MIIDFAARKIELEDAKFRKETEKAIIRRRKSSVFHDIINSFARNDLTFEEALEVMQDIKNHITDGGKSA